MKRRDLLKQCAATVAVWAVPTRVAPEVLVPKRDDIAILNGRVIDPESKRDSIHHVAIRDGKIRSIGGRRPHAEQIIDARGMVVAPGFIDVNGDAAGPRAIRKALDGVTTALDLEGGTIDIAAFYAAGDGKRVINTGTSVGHLPVRGQVMPGNQTPETLTGDAANRAATPSEVQTMQRLIEEGLRQGALAVGFGIQYTPGATSWEIMEMFRVAARYKAPCVVHQRQLGESKVSDSIAGLEELLTASFLTGAPLHMVHVNSTGLLAAPRLLQMIGEAKARGLDVSTDCYPYTAGGNSIASAFWDGDWRTMLGIDYKDLQWAATGERLTPETFEKYRKSGGLVIVHAIPEQIVQTCLASPHTMIESDAGVGGHPRGTGTYSRILGRYVREQKLLPLMDALRKMTLMPAQRFEKRAPMMRNKGRLREEADADIVVFDPDRIRDRSTFEQADLTSEGMQWVMVNGVPVVRDGKPEPKVFPGMAVRAPRATDRS